MTTPRAVRPCAATPSLARLVALLVLFAAAALPGPLAAQETVTARVLSRSQGGTTVVLVGSDTMFLVPAASMRNALKTAADLAAARREIAARDSLLAAQDLSVARYDTFFTRQRRYVQELEAQLAGYQKLAEGYKHLSTSGQWLSLDGGLGATGDSRPAIIAGLGIRRLRVWGFVQEHNAGGMLGVHLPLL